MKTKICVLTIIQIMMLIFAFAIVATAEEAAPNPPLKVNGTNGTCGLDIVLILDSSDSLSSSELQEVKDAANAFVTSLADTGSNFSVIDVDSQIVSSLPFTSDISAVNAAINSISHNYSTELTNWHAAFTEAYSNILSGDDPKLTNIVIFITDGDPTTYGYPTSLGSYGGIEPDYEDINYAIQAANLLKENGTRILTVGVTSSPTLENLINVSGPNVDTGNLTSDVITTNISDLADTLADFSQLCCGQTDLSIAKSGITDLVYPGESLTYIIEVTNHGGHAAYGINVVDELPAEAVFVDANPAPASGSFSTYTWNIESILVGETVSIIVNVTINESASPGVITNTANVHNDTYDPYLENNSCIEYTTVGNASDLGIVKSDSVNFVYPEDSFTYNLNVTNYGPTDAANVVISDILPDKITFKSAVPFQPEKSGQTYFWNLSTLAVGESIEIEIDVVVNNVTSQIISNIAEVTSDNGDIFIDNNVDIEETTIIMKTADLNVEKIDSLDPLFEGDNLTYFINVTNNGPNEAENVVILDSLPSEVTFTNASRMPSGFVGSNYYWNVSSLASGESCLIEINVTINEGVLGVISNTVSASSDTVDLISDNNEDTEETLIMAKADLEIVKSDRTSSVKPKGSFTYILNVTNHGPNVAVNINTSDILPSEVSYVNASIQPNGNDSSMYYWIIPSLDSNESVEILIDVKVRDGVSNTIISNTAIVSSETFDPISENNQDTEQTDVEKKDKDNNDNKKEDDDITKSPSHNKPTANAGGPYFETIGNEIQFNGSASHDNDEGQKSIVRFDWKFFELDVFHNDSGEYPTYLYSEPGVYMVTLRVFDDEGDYDENITYVTITQPNRPPNTPQITGPENGTQNTSYKYTIVSTDPDGDDIYYVVDFNDGIEIITNATSSGVEVELSHLWSNNGSYTISVIAYDVYNASSSPATLIVLMEPDILKPNKEETGNGFNWLPLLVILLLLLLFLLLTDYMRRKNKKGDEKGKKSKKKPVPKK